jgi:transcriptional regulator with XRE-family HTH domain
MSRNKKKHKNELRAYRKQAGYSQKEMTRLLGFESESRLSEWEHACAIPSLRNLFKLSVIYKVEPKTLFREIYTDSKQEVKRKKKELCSVHYSREDKLYRKRQIYEDIKTHFESEDQTMEYFAEILISIYIEQKKWKHGILH